MREEIRQMGQDARMAAHEMAKIGTAQKRQALEAVAVALGEARAAIDAANRKDIAEALDKGLPAAKVDRLRLTDKVLAEMTDGLRRLPCSPIPWAKSPACGPAPTG